MSKAKTAAHLPPGLTRILLISALPIISTNSLSAILQFTDAAMVSSLGSTTLAALGPASFALAVPVGFGLGLVASVNTCVAQAHSRHERIRARCSRFGIQGIWLGLIFGLLCLALFPTAEPLFLAFHCTGELGAKATAYFEVSLFAIAFQIATAALGGYFVGVGKPRIVLQGAAIGTASNIILNYLFIFGTFGFPQLGLRGAALGTVLASIIHFIYALTRFIVNLRGLDKAQINWKPRKRTLLRLTNLGWPLGVHTGIDLLSWGFVILLIGWFGEAHLAAATVVARCIHLSFLPADGMGIALSNAISDAIGDGRAAMAEAYAAISLKLITSYMVSVGLLLLVFRYQIFDWFSDDPLVIEIGVKAMIFACAIQFFDAMGITYYCSLLGTGDNAWPMRVTLLSTIGWLGVGGWAIIEFCPQVGSLGIWMLDAVYVAILGITFRWRWRSGHWKTIDIFQN